MSPVSARAHIDVVGLGPAGSDLITAEAQSLLQGGDIVWLRTVQHPAAVVAPGAASFDTLYERLDTFAEVYQTIVDSLIETARSKGDVVYAVPGSPLVAERTVSLLRSHPAVVSGEVSVVVHPALSFLDLVYQRVGVDPIASGVRLVDGEDFAVGAADNPGPLLVAQCWSTHILSAIKLSAEVPADTPVTVLSHLGLPEERVWDVAWSELDRSFEPDHLTSLWIPKMAPPVASELARLDELMHTLRERCPWDRRQTHGSLSRHLMEESYEVLEAIDALAAIDAPVSDAIGAVSPAAEEQAVAHLEEELGDLLFQVYFHATLAAEQGRFTLADVARGIHDKLVARHPLLFGVSVAGGSGTGGSGTGGTGTGGAGTGGTLDADQAAADWEALKKQEKGRASVTEGIPAALPALALASKLQRKGEAVGMAPINLDNAVASLREALAADLDAEQVGDLFFSLVGVARALDVDPEAALRIRAAAFRTSVEEHG